MSEPVETETSDSRSSQRPTVNPRPEDGERGVSFRLEHLAGMRLATALTLNRVFTPRDVAAFGLQVCEALALVHAEGEIHGSVRPANLVLGAGNEATPADTLVRDVPVASRAKGAAKRPVLAVLRYRAPELVPGNDAAPIGPRADVWALGAVLYEMLTGRAPFHGTTTVALTTAITHAALVPVLTRRPETPAELALVIERCLAREPEQRFGDVAELADALAPFAPRETRISSIRTRNTLAASAHEPAELAPLALTARPAPPMPTRVAPPLFVGTARRAHVRATLGIAAVLWLGAVGVVVLAPQDASPSRHTAPSR